MKKVQYRVIPVTRYLVTRYSEEAVEFADGQSTHACGSEERGEFNNERVAYDVAYALCKAEHDASGEPFDSMTFIYPSAPQPIGAVSSVEGLAAQKDMAKFQDYCTQVSGQMTI